MLRRLSGLTTIVIIAMTFTQTAHADAMGLANLELCSHYGSKGTVSQFAQYLESKSKVSVYELPNEEMMVLKMSTEKGDLLIGIGKIKSGAIVKMLEAGGSTTTLSPETEHGIKQFVSQLCANVGAASAAGIGENGKANELPSAVLNAAELGSKILKADGKDVYAISLGELERYYKGDSRKASWRIDGLTTVFVTNLASGQKLEYFFDTENHPKEAGAKAMKLVKIEVAGTKADVNKGLKMIENAVEDIAVAAKHAH